jgi:hypothetical protein
MSKHKNFSRFSHHLLHEQRACQLRKNFPCYDRHLLFYGGVLYFIFQLAAVSRLVMKQGGKIAPLNEMELNPLYCFGSKIFVFVFC